MNGKVEELMEKVTERLGVYFGSQYTVDEYKAVVKSLIPIIRQAVVGDMQEQIDELNKKLNDREADLINAKKEEREAVAEEIIKEKGIPTRYKHNATCYDCLERLKKKYCGATSGQKEG